MLTCSFTLPGSTYCAIRFLYREYYYVQLITV
nr:MAG TPA: hypothetical protein [Caudoviricetes sp.]